MTHPDHARQPRDGAAVEEHLAAIQLRYEAAKASIIGPVDDEALPETEAIDLRRLPPVPRGVGEDRAVPAAVFHDNVVVADVPGRRRWWHLRLPDGRPGKP